MIAEFLWIAIVVFVLALLLATVGVKPRRGLVDRTGHWRCVRRAGGNQ